MGRMNMGKQLTGNRVKKKALGGALGAMASGDIRGAIGGVIPNMLVQKKLREEAEAAANKDEPKKMAKGGRADGCCMKGKTKGRMR